MSTLTSSIDITAPDTQAFEHLALAPGQVYNQPLVKRFSQKHLFGADVNNSKILERWFDERKGTIAHKLTSGNAPAEEGPASFRVESGRRKTQLPCAALR